MPTMRPSFSVSPVKRGAWHPCVPIILSRHSSSCSRRRLSSVWIPSPVASSADEFQTSHGKLCRAGFLRQSYSGIFHLLPLGLRVQSKLERLLEHHMGSISASRLSLSTITTEELWKSSGRFDQLAPEVFRFTDRRDARYMLSPTHEEEITTLIARNVFSYKELPIRLYQITSKFRDELRPRHGLLRSREFVMKDLYTFDTTPENALETYKQVQAAYIALFCQLRLPVVVAEASSGDMGGDRSHEFHLPCNVGEDLVVNCNECGYTANGEVAQAAPLDATSVPERPPPTVAAWRGITKDRKILVTVLYSQSSAASGELSPTQSMINVHAVKAIVPTLDASIDGPAALWNQARESGEQVRTLTLIDETLSSYTPALDLRALAREHLLAVVPSIDAGIEPTLISEAPGASSLRLLRVQDGDYCGRCRIGRLQVRKALELGHTFYLGTRYSKPLGARVQLPSGQGLPNGSHSSAVVPLQMGCFGIGVSRVFGAIAEHFSDERGLVWPPAAAPFEAVVIPGSGLEEDAMRVFDAVATGADTVLDDRPVNLGWKLKDAELVGYPVIILVANTWKKSRMCEVRCRRSGKTATVSLEDVHSVVACFLNES